MLTAAIAPNTFTPPYPVSFQSKKTHMNPSKFHTREGYERLYLQLRKEDGLPTGDVSKLTDYQLLTKINDNLLKYNCIPLTQDELERDLS